jgi:Xaa-Pro aminopeptidase
MSSAARSRACCRATLRSTPPCSRTARLATSCAFPRRSLYTTLKPTDAPTRSDTWARRALWADGLDYRHGTGHGVGHYLNVHEGPHGIGTRIACNAAPLRAGMTVSNEPGFYADGRWGIRIESVVVVGAARTPHDFGGKGFLRMERLTMVRSAVLRCFCFLFARR